MGAQVASSYVRTDALQVTPQGGMFVANLTFGQPAVEQNQPRLNTRCSIRFSQHFVRSQMAGSGQDRSQTCLRQVTLAGLL
jgi:hypothetical protein